MNYLNIFFNTFQRLSPTRVCYIFRRNNLGLNVNLDNFLTPVDLKNFKTIIIDIYSKNIFLYFSSHSISKAPFINLEFHSFKNFYNHPDYSNYNKYISVPNTNNKCDISSDALLHNSNIDNDNYLIPKDNGTEKRNLKYRTLEELIHKYEHGTSCSLLIKLINKYIKVKVKFNGTKILQGILDKVTPDTILLKDGNYTHVIRIDSISIIHTLEDINLNDLVSNDSSYYILQ